MGCTPWQGQQQMQLRMGHNQYSPAAAVPGELALSDSSSEIVFRTTAVKAIAQTNRYYTLSHTVQLHDISMVTSQTVPCITTQYLDNVWA